MVDLRGLTATQVNQRLTQFTQETGIGVSWSFVEVATTNPAQYGVVVGSTPPAGTPIGPSESIVVRFGTAP